MSEPHTPCAEETGWFRFAGIGFKTTVEPQAAHIHQRYLLEATSRK